VPRLRSGTLKTEHVGYEKLRGRYPSLFLSYCLDEPKASGLFKYRYRDERSLVRRAMEAAARGVEPEVMDALRRYYKELEAPREAWGPLEKLGRGAAAVVTGQQPSVGMGPLYNFHKAQAALRYAQGIEARGVPCVAVFWNHSDDVKGGEAVFFPDRGEPRMKDVGLGRREEGRLLAEALPPDLLRTFASVLSGALPGTEYAGWLSELVGTTHRTSIAESFSRILLRTLAPFGLVVLEPRHLEGSRAERFFAAHLSHPERMGAAVNRGRRVVTEAGFDDHLGKEVGLDLFEVREGRRIRLEAPPAAGLRGRLSAGVALRPILQDAVLPTCAYVGGPSEIGYQAALWPAYQEFGIDPPVILPRVTATLLEPKIARVREKAGLGAAELFLDETALAPRFIKQEEDVADALEKLSERMMTDVADLMRRLPQGQTVERAQEKTRTKVREALEALATRVRDEQARQDSTGRGLLAKLLLHVRPGGDLQERVVTPLYYAALFGPDFFPRLLNALDPFVFSHQVISL
jgi:uncharacterized protein YllA (UPF0747 family)